MADISRDDLATIIQEEYSNELLDTAVQASVALQAFRRVDMGTKTTNLPVLATIPEASFVGETLGSDRTKPTSAATWDNKILTAQEIAVIIAVDEDAVDDATTAVLDDLTTQGGNAIGRALDAAVLFGVNKPAAWTSDDLMTAATNASQVVTVGDVADGDDIGGSILQAAGMVDEAGWDPSDVLAPRGLRYRMANLRNVDGTPIFLPSLSSSAGALDMIAGLNARWVSGRVWDRDQAEALVVDAERVIIGVRRDITVKFLTEATVGSINLAEEDMVALRFKARYAYVLADTFNEEGDSEVPVAAVLPAGS